MFIKSCAKFYLSLSLVLISITFNYSASIYYEKPSSARLAAASHSPPACKYQNKKYAHGERVVTPEPCLNCTCKKGVLLCFLRVCPTLIPSSPNDICETVRESGQCCPILKCESRITTSSPISTTQLIESELLSSSQNNVKVDITTTDKPEMIPTTGKPLQGEVTMHYASGDFSGETKLIDNRVDNRITVTHKGDSTTIFQTSPSTTFHDSILLVTSSPSSFDKEAENILNTIQGGCIINGTIYAEGSAVLSTSFCEYCYCIRSKRMCIRPRCHLSIMGCLPRYTSEYACCPTSYVCGEQALTTFPATTTTTTTSTQSTVAYARKSVCIVDGVSYQIGEAIQSDEHCKQCYCSIGALKKCKKIQCSPAMDGCVPIVPEGHCCPVEYKCNTTQRSRFDEIEELTTMRTLTSMFDDVLAFSTDLYAPSTKSSEIDGDSVTPEYFERKIQTERSGFIENSESTTMNHQTTLSKRSNEIIDISENDEISSSTESDKILDHTDKIEVKIMKKPISLSLKSNIVNDNDKMNSSQIPTSSTTLTSSTSSTSSTSPTTLTISTSSTSSTHKPDLEIIKNFSQLDTTTGVSYTSTLLPLNNVSQTSDIITSSIDLLFTTEKPNEPAHALDRHNEEEVTNSSGLDNILEGIIHAIDKHLHRRLPAEPRESIRNKDTPPNETLNFEPLKTNDDQMPLSKSADENFKIHQPIGTSRSQINFNNNKGVSSTILIADDHHGPDTGGDVEIITARTPFHDLAHQNDDSILINLTPSSLKVGTSITMGSKFAFQNPPPPQHSHNNDHSLMKTPQYSIGGGYSSNNWKTVNNQHQYNHGNRYHGHGHGQPIMKPVGSVDSLYYNGGIRREDTYDPSEEETLDKRPRLEIANGPSMEGPNLKVIPFKVQDAVSGMTQTLNKRNGSFAIRLPTPQKGLSHVSPKPQSQQTSCFFNSQEFPNGAMISKPDPCTLCRCFYGRELCQEQKCPAPPEKDCSPEKVPGYCCPRYICRIIDDGKAPIGINTTSQHTNGPTITVINNSPIRKGPQFQPTVPPVTSTAASIIKSENPFINITEILPENMNHYDDMSRKEEVDRFYQTIPEYPAVPAHVHGLQSKYPPFPLDPTPNSKPFSKYPYNNNNNNNNNNGGPYSQIGHQSGHQSGHQNGNGNRVHFPMNYMNNAEKEKDDRINEPINHTPPRSDTISALIPPRPRPLLTNNRNQPQNQYSQGGNTYRIKPPQTFNQHPPQLTSSLSNSRPALRLPPFLLNTKPGPNPYGIRTKPMNTHIPSSVLPSDQMHYAKPIITSEPSGFNNRNDNRNDPNLAVVSKISEIIPVKEDMNKINRKNISETKFILTSPTTIVTTVSSTTVTNTAKLDLPIKVNTAHETSISTPSTPSTPSTTEKKLWITTKEPKIQLIETTTEKRLDKTTVKSKISNPWDLLRVSGCNIYGTFYKVDEEINQLNSHCKRCVCSSMGVKCNSIC